MVALTLGGEELLVSSLSDSNDLFFPWETDFSINIKIGVI